MIQEFPKELPILMWYSAGMCRRKKALDDAIAQVEICREQLATLPLSQTILNLQPGKTLNFSLPSPYNFQLRTWVETYNLLDVGYLILKSAGFGLKVKAVTTG
ncbi:hypothetical protein PN499_02060 [Kamptonema animale CS-326]|jgi:L-aspartate oxidase|uniref:hypothetical protein n=1 Tax=Kamptonema animale TaxID=92934 RepID=UPI0023312F84|nr:hypothetical protein [Kamptonema animale]MDB9509991.1 hypothetical protein [Kamptonema animale CS-326]